MRIDITGDFDPNKLRAMIRQRGLQLASSRLRELLSNVQCSQHPGQGHVTPKLSALDKVEVSVSACCDAFRAQVEQRLCDAGVHEASVDTESSQKEESEALSGPPTAFLSHSSADKDAIVRPLDSMLRARGISTWLDQRDMPAGSNLMDSIFSAGISQSDAFVVVLTPNSIDSSWVHEELSVAVVRKIQKRVKRIIPVVYLISDDQVPDALVATKWIRLKDISEAELLACTDDIAIALFGAMPAPIAPPPAHAGIPIHSLPGLTANDERLFAQIYRLHLDLPYFHPAIGTSDIVEYGKDIGLTPDAVLESLQVLVQNAYLDELGYYLGSGSMPGDIRVSEYGIEMYLTTYEPERYAAAKNAVVSEIVNKNTHRMSIIIQNTGLSHPMVHHILKQLELNGHVKVLFGGGGDAAIMAQSSLRRLLD